MQGLGSSWAHPAIWSRFGSARTHQHISTLTKETLPGAFLTDVHLQPIRICTRAPLVIFQNLLCSPSLSISLVLLSRCKNLEAELSEQCS